MWRKQHWQLVVFIAFFSFRPALSSLPKYHDPVLVHVNSSFWLYHHSIFDGEGWAYCPLGVQNDSLRVRAKR